jgi:predicted secreted hydrolase
LQGQDGYSIKSANGKHASHYYSAPFIKVEGTFTLSDSGKQIAVNGNAWFDQEWTSQLLDQTTLGWDWLSLHLDNGDKIMAFQMRLQDQADYITGTYIDADGSTTTLMPSDIELSALELTSVGNKELPLYWQLEVKSKGVKVSINATKNDQWNPALIAYYEGTVAVSGTHSGRGFLELTGY